ncbi:MAG: type II toxin-antitoxin system VapB family antitoxin [Phycisphaeraceae bacterium]
MTSIHINLDETLLDEAVRIGKHANEEEAVRVALEEYVRYRQQLSIIDLFGTIEFDHDFDYKAERRRGLKRVRVD